MENIAKILVETFNLEGVQAGYNAIGIAFIALFCIVVIWNIVSAKSSKDFSKDLEQDLEQGLEQKVEKETSTPVKISEPVEPVEEVVKVAWHERLLKGMEKTRKEVWGKVGSILTSSNISEEQYEEIEEILYTSDMSIDMAEELLDNLKIEAKKITDPKPDDFLQIIHGFLKGKMVSIQDKVNKELYHYQQDNQNGPKVIMVVGVNGAGKTTTIGKLATKLKDQGAKVVVGACDTFRAAAVEQLEVWCKRAQVEIVKANEGADPSGVAYDAVAKAKEINADYCIIDTAGRLHTKSNLMDELAKTKKVMSKVIPEAPHETLLVIDAITGQNALKQAQEFNNSLELSGLIFTKCDGSAKAGGAVGIVQKLQVPIVYIGVGEQVEDLDVFDLDEYLGALLGA